MTPADRNRRWVRQAFEAEVQAVLTSGSGGRNTELHRAACRCLELANTTNELTVGEVRDRLLEAATAAGLPRREALAVLRSARRSIGDQDVRHQLPAEEVMTPSKREPLDVARLFDRPAVRTDAHPSRMPREELARVWAMAGPPHPRDLTHLSGQPRPGIVPCRVLDLDLARTLPSIAKLPPWGAWWPRTGHRLLVETVDANGDVVGLRARSLGAPRGQLPKELAPKGFETRGTVVACPLARRLLSGDREAAELVRTVGLVLTEGVPSWLAWASDWSDADEDAMGAIGYQAGGWTKAHADRVPSGTRVIVDPDSGAAGERMLRKIVQTFGGRVAIEVTTSEAACG